MRMCRASSLLAVSLCLPTACGNPTQPQGVVQLESLSFLKSTFQLDEPVIVVAGTADSAVPMPGVLRVRSSSGTQIQADLNPWAGLSDAHLLVLIGAAEGRVFIGFVGSAETVEQMKAELRESGIIITREYHIVASVAAVMPIDMDLLVRFRHHPNITHVEPIFPYFIAAGPPPPQLDLAAVIPTTGGGALHVESGSELVATYVQPDGTVLRAVAHMQ